MFYYYYYYCYGAIFNNFVLIIWFSEIIENPETGEPTETEAIEDKLSSGGANSGCDNNIMTDNSTYRAAGTQSSNDSALPTKDKPASELQANSGTTKDDSDINGGGKSTANFDTPSSTTI